MSVNKSKREACFGPRSERFTRLLSFSRDHGYGVGYVFEMNTTEIKEHIQNIDSGDKFVAAAAMKDVHKLVIHDNKAGPGMCRAVIEAVGPLSLLRAMEKWIHDPDLVKMVLEITTALSVDFNMVLFEGWVLSGLLDTLLEAMKKNSSNKDIQEYGLVILNNISELFPGFLGYLLLKGDKIHETIGVAMKAFPESEHVQSTGCSLLRSLLESEESLDPPTKDFVLKALVRSMVKYEHDDNFKKIIAQCLKYLFSDDLY